MIVLILPLAVTGESRVHGNENGVPNREHRYSPPSMTSGIPSLKILKMASWLLPCCQIPRNSNRNLFPWHCAVKAMTWTTGYPPCLSDKNYIRINRSLIMFKQNTVHYFFSPAQTLWSKTHPHSKPQRVSPSHFPHSTDQQKYNNTESLQGF